MTATEIPYPTTTDPLGGALSFVLQADEAAAHAEEARNVGADYARHGLAEQARESHSLAGRFRETERLALKRAQVSALVSIAQSLEALADEAQRMGLAR